MTGHLAGAVHDLAHGKTLPVAQVADEVITAALQMIQGPHMGVHQVGDGDVVADAGPVGRSVIITEDGDMRPPAQRHLQDQRDEMALGAVVLADAAVGQGPGHIEITQGDIADAMGHRDPAHHGLHHQLAVPVRIGGPGGGILADGHAVGLAVDRRRGREHDAAHAMTDHGFQQALHAAHIIVEVLEGIDHALAHLRIGGEVHDAVDAETAEDAVQTGGIADVALHEGSLARHGGGMARLEIVHHHDFLPGRCQGMDRVGTDIARTAANKDRHTDLHNKDDDGGTLRCLPAAGKARDAQGLLKAGQDIKEARSP